MNNENILHFIPYTITQMSHADIKFLTGLFLLQNKKILLLEKKIETGTVWTLPFRQVYGFRHPTEHLKDLTKELFDIEINRDHLIKKLIVHKLSEDADVSIGFFPSTITREWKIRLNKFNIFKKFERFSYDELPQNITDDLRKIIIAHNNNQKYIEL